MTTALALACAMVLDAILGEPKWLWSRVPHPAVLIGRGIGWADHRFNQGTARKEKGIALLLALVIGGWTIGAVLSEIPFADILIGAILLAQKSLIDHVRAVAHALRQSLESGRNTVAMIVGRDTTEMDAPAVARAAIESAAENFSDGVIAPAFWFLIFGLPGILVYKAVNTADSMIGHRTDRHRDFGWAAARCDDLLNLIPARLTAILLFPWRSTLWSPQNTGSQLQNWRDRWRDIIHEAKRHRSPNAGWPEAAISRSLGIALSGPRSYHGKMQNQPWVNPTGRKDATPEDIEAACHILWKSWSITLIVAILLFAS